MIGGANENPSPLRACPHQHNTREMSYRCCDEDDPGSNLTWQAVFGANSHCYGVKGTPTPRAMPVGLEPEPRRLVASRRKRTAMYSCHAACHKQRCPGGQMGNCTTIERPTNLAPLTPEGAVLPTQV